MTVDTKKVSGRRDLRFDSYDDMLADAERLAGGQGKTVGNWTIGQIFLHLSKSMHAAIDGMEMKVPWLMKKFFGLFMNKKKMLNEALNAGFKIPKKGEAQFKPADDVSTADGLAALREAVERSQNDRSRAPHPIFGELTAEEWDQFNLRHAEMHMSFAVED